MRSRRSRIALGCCLAGCVVIVAAGAVSAFWSVTVGQQSWGVRLTSGNVLARRIPFTPGNGHPVATGLAIAVASHPGIEPRWPGVTSSGVGYLSADIPLWLGLMLFASMSLMLWAGGRQPPPTGHCACGYSLTGNQSGVCPECGAKVQPAATPV